jgi:protease II
MLDDLAAGNWRTESYQIGDMQKKFRTFKDFMEVLNYVTDMAASDAGTASRRTHAKNGGRASS